MPKPQTIEKLLALSQNSLAPERHGYNQDRINPVYELYLRRKRDPPDLVKTDFETMFSHIVIFWTDPAISTATDDLIAGAIKYLKPIQGVLHFHVGKMASSHRPVVDQSYQVALNLVFPSKKAQDDYQVHPQHIEFVEKVFKPLCKRVVIYDFE